MRKNAAAIARRFIPVLAVLVLGAPSTAQAGHVVIFPVTGKKLPRTYKKAPTMFTEFLAQAVRDLGREATVADASLDDTSMMLGCDATAISCLEMVAQTLGAEELLFAVVRRGRRNAKLRVTLSRFRPGEDRENENVKLTADSLMGLATQLTNHTKAFLGGEVLEEPATPPVAEVSPTPNPDTDTTTATTTTEPVAAVETKPDAGFSMGRVKGYTWAIAGIGAVAAGAGGTFLAMAGGIRSDIAKAPTDTKEDLADLADQEKKGRTFSDVGTGLLAVGGAALVTAVVLMVMQGGSSDEIAESGDSAVVGIAPWLTPDGVGVAVTFDLVP